MKRFTNDVPSSTKHLPVLLELDDSPVYFIGPATRDNPMFQVRTKLMGKVIFQDRKIKWNRVTLQFIGKAGIDIECPGALNNFNMGEMDSSRIQTTITICEVEKELIFSGEESIDFGLHLPPHLPASSRTDHAFVEYTLIANFSAGSFFKKYKTQNTVTVKRHYLPNPSAMIPTINYSGIQRWFEWSAEIPKAAAVEAGEVVLGFRCNIEKERVEVDRIDLAIEQIESYRFCTKQGIHKIPSIIKQFPSATYHLPSFSSSSETHYIRSPIPNKKHPGENNTSIHTHQYDPFLEITHRCLVTVHFNKVTNASVEPIQLEFPIIITDYPSCTIVDLFSSLQNTESIMSTEHQHDTTPLVTSGDDAVNIYLDLPEYTPKYEESNCGTAFMI